MKISVIVPVYNCKAYVEKLEDPTSFTLTSHISSTTVLESEWGYMPEMAALLKGAEGTFTWADGSTTQWSFDKEWYRHSYPISFHREIKKEEGRRS